MLNLAIFISGRLLGYPICLLPVINNLKKKNYKVHLFFSINTFSLNVNDRNAATLEYITNDLKNKFGESLCYCNFEEYKIPKYIVENFIKNNITTFSYNVFSCFYNDKKNFDLIEEYEKNNNVKFDIICKMRSELKFNDDDVNFILDNKDDLIIHNKHMMDIRHWGHVYNDTPAMISDAFAYGNKNSMKIYCSTYDWILSNNLNELYHQTFEIVLTDSILQDKFYKIIGGGESPLLTKEQIIDKYINNPRKIKINYISGDIYVIMPNNIRSINNFIVDINNVNEYTQI
jgi:hypothetical protein